MATYYIDPVSGLDTNAGTIGAPKQTLIGFNTVPTITLANDDVVGLMNSGNHPWPDTADEYSITKRVIIKGVTTGGSAATATISANSAAAKRYVQAQAGAEITFENVIIDATGQTASANAFDFIRYNGATALMQMRGVSFLVSNLAGGTAPAGIRRFFNQVSNPGTGVDTLTCYRCYLQNADQCVTLNAVTDQTFQECVWIGDITALNWITKSLAAGTGGSVLYSNNTLYVDTGAAQCGAPLTYSHAGATAGLTAQNNLIFMNSTNGSTLISFLRDANGPNPVTGTRGNNVLLGGADVSGIGEIYGDGWQEASWDADQNDAAGLDVEASTVVAYAQNAASVFNNPTGPLAWSTVNGQTITLPKDLRPKLYLTAGVGSTVPGALPAASTDFALSLAASRSNPVVDETVTFTLTVTNTGTTALSVVVSLPVVSGLTYVSSVPTQGSYDSGTGQWAIGTMLNAGSATLTLTTTVNSDQAGNTIVMTGTYVSSDISDNNGANDVSTATLTVVDDGVIGGDGITPFIDVVPFYTDVMQLDVGARLSTTYNRVVSNYLRYDRRREAFREFSARRLTIAGSTTVTINMGGIQRASFLLIEATTGVSVSISTSSDRYFPAATVVYVGQADFEILKIQNPLTTSVDVMIVAVD